MKKALSIPTILLLLSGLFANCSSIGTIQVNYDPVKEAHVSTLSIDHQLTRMVMIGGQLKPDKSQDVHIIYRIESNSNGIHKFQISYILPFSTIIEDEAFVFLNEQKYKLKTRHLGSTNETDIALYLATGLPIQESNTTGSLQFEPAIYQEMSGAHSMSYRFYGSKGPVKVDVNTKEMAEIRKLIAIAKDPKSYKPEEKPKRSSGTRS